MCEPKPGPRCVTDTRDAASTTAAEYAAHHPGGPLVDPLTSASASFRALAAVSAHIEDAMLRAAGCANMHPDRTTWDVWRALSSTSTKPSAALEVLRSSGEEHLLPELADLHGVQQDPDWHPEGDVWVHSTMAADKAAELADHAGLTGQDRSVVVLAALLHDTGKPQHTQVVKDAGRERIRHIGHADGGVAPTEAFLTRIGTPSEVRDRVLPLVREHMVAAGVRKPSVQAVRRLIARLGPATLSEWAMVVEADRDRGGRGRQGDGAPPGDWLKVNTATNEVRERSLLTGKHLVAAGLVPGPRFRTLLDEARQAESDGVFTDEVGAVSWLDARLAD